MSESTRDTSIEAMRLSLSRTGRFDVAFDEGALRVIRRRTLPEGGILRIMIPRVVASVRIRRGAARIRVLPDRIGLLVLFVLYGCSVVELTMDRVTYPREYPPEFLYGSVILYVAFLLLEGVRTTRAIRAALTPGA